MPFSSPTSRGSASSGANGASIGFSPTAALVLGRLVVVTVVTDNFATPTGPTTRHSTLVDTKGNVWHKLFEHTHSDAGAANDGCTVSVWYSVLTTQIETSDTITCSWTGNQINRLICGFEVTMSGGAIAVEQSNVSVLGTEAAVAGMPSREYLLVGIGAAEGSDTSKTPDADYGERFDFGSGGTSVHVVTRIATLTADTCTTTTWVDANFIFSLTAFFLNAGVGGNNVARCGRASGIGASASKAILGE
jgi:hypothetical protein